VSAAAFPQLNAEAFAKMPAPCSPVPADPAPVTITSPAFSASAVVAPHVTSSAILSIPPVSAPIDLSESLNLSASREQQTVVPKTLAGLPTGVSLS